jgi:ABC-type Zn uptake system ZnuABC Zn-binding protein ZnuA
MRIPPRILGCSLLLAASLPAATDDPRAADRGARVEVVASLPNLASIATAVGGGRVEVTSIATGTQDAHFIDPKPSYMSRMRRADLLLVNGLDLEIGWIPPLTEGARNPKLLRGGPGHIDCSAGVPVVEVPASLSRAEGDVHPFGNPHYLTDPLNAEIVAATIAAALARVDPDGAGAYEEGRRAFARRLHEALFGKELVDLIGGAKLAREAAAGTLDAFLDGAEVGGSRLRARLGGWLGRMAAVRGRPVVTYHRDYAYFAARFGIRVVDHVEPKPGIPPSPRHLEDLVQRLGGGDVRVVITRPFVEHRSTDYIAARTGARVITLPLEAGGAPEAADYFALFDHVTGRLVEALAGPPAPPASR